nr:uncharacterized protein LOC117275368 [Nicotiana tomentosiformis]
MKYYWILSSIVIWELWRSKCSSKYKMERPSIARTISLINFNIIQIVKAQFRKLEFNYSWENLCRVWELPLMETNTSMVKWIKPHILFVKLNSDDSCRNGECGGGGVVRDKYGKIYNGLLHFLGQGTSNWAEACAFLFGIKWCIEIMFNLIIGETNSMLLQNCISGN